MYRPDGNIPPSAPLTAAAADDDEHPWTGMMIGRINSPAPWFDGANNVPRWRYDRPYFAQCSSRPGCLAGQWKMEEPFSFLSSLTHPCQSVSPSVTPPLPSSPSQIDRPPPFLPSDPYRIPPTPAFTAILEPAGLDSPSAATRRYALTVTPSKNRFERFENAGWRGSPKLRMILSQ